MVMTQPQKSAPNTPPKKGVRLAYKLKEVSELVGVPVSTLRSMIHRKELNPITGFKTWLLAAEDVHELLDRRLHARRPADPKEGGK